MIKTCSECNITTEMISKIYHTENCLLWRIKSRFPWNQLYFLCGNVYEHMSGTSFFSYMTRPTTV